MFKPAAGSWECKGCYTRNAADASQCVACEGPSHNSSSSVPAPKNSGKKPLSEMFKPPTGSWSCTQCYVQNSAANSDCMACGQSKDPSVKSEPSAPQPTFSFGAKEGTASSGGFSFNLSGTNTASGKPASEPISIFGGGKPGGYTFGTPPNSPPQSNNSNFCFGSPGKSFDFQFQNKTTPVKSPEKAETSDDEVTESEDVYFAPVIPLPDKIEVKTGEEDEDVLYSHRAKLYKFDTATKEWKERGLGDIKLLRHKENKRYRLVMRRDQVLKLCLNHAVNAQLEITAKDDKAWQWSAHDYSEGEVEFLQFACRFKNGDIAKDFKRAVDEAIEHCSANLPVKKSLPEIEIVYEIKVSKSFFQP